LHELEIVDNQQIEATLSLKPPRFPTHLLHRHGAGVVDIDRRLLQLPGRFREAPPVFLLQPTGPERMRIDAGLGTQHAEHELRLRHFEAENADDGAGMQRGMLRHPKRQTGLTHTQTAGNDDQIRRL